MKIYDYLDIIPDDTFIQIRTNLIDMLLALKYRIRYKLMIKEMIEINKLSIKYYNSEIVLGAKQLLTKVFKFTYPCSIYSIVDIIKKYVTENDLMSGKFIVPNDKIIEIIKYNYNHINGDVYTFNNFVDIIIFNNIKMYKNNINNIIIEY